MVSLDLGQKKNNLLKNIEFEIGQNTIGEEIHGTQGQRWLWEKTLAGN